MNNKQWLVYRKPGRSLESLIRDAIEFYTQRYGSRPECMMIGTYYASAAREHTDIEIIPNGGTLGSEIWLPNPDPQQMTMEL